MVQILDYQTPLMAGRSGHSRAGIASAVLALVMMVLFVALAVFMVLARQSNRSGTMVPAAIIATPFPLCIIGGVVCGIIGVAQGKRKRLWAVLGLAINGLALLVLFMGFLVAGFKTTARPMPMPMPPASATSSVLQTW